MDINRYGRNIQRCNNMRMLYMKNVVLAFERNYNITINNSIIIQHINNKNIM